MHQDGWFPLFVWVPLVSFIFCSTFWSQTLLNKISVEVTSWNKGYIGELVKTKWLVQYGNDLCLPLFQSLFKDGVIFTCLQEQEINIIKETVFWEIFQFNPKKNKRKAKKGNNLSMRASLFVLLSVLELYAFPSTYEMVWKLHIDRPQYLEVHDLTYKIWLNYVLTRVNKLTTRWVS